MWTLVSATVVFIADQPARGANGSVACRGIDRRAPNSDSADRPAIGDHWTMTDARPSPSRADRENELRTEVAAVGSLITEPVTLPLTRLTYSIVRPADTDRLLDQVAGDPEQNLPYWAEIWPSGIALADAIARAPELVQGQRTLELGAGLGITACAALAAGAELTVTDYASEALALCGLNTLRNVGRGAATIRLNWRRPDPVLFELARGGFPVVLAADVLYERRDIAPLLALVERIVSPDGLLWLAEPGRAVAAAFVETARARGWAGSSETHAGPWPDPKDAGVVVTVHQLRRS
jgi:predicted nicotinamide N-methyase